MQKIACWQEKKLFNNWLGKCRGRKFVSLIFYNIPVDQLRLQFLKHCYLFVNNKWQHVTREPSLLDQGFEQCFRENCIKELSGWNISQEREMYLGCKIDTASGVSHEIDIVAHHPNLIAIVEMKNRPSIPPEKNDVIVFFAKIMDYLAFNPALLLKEVCPVFMSNTHFEHSGLAACLGLGIHPIAPELRPLPILFDNARRMDFEIKNNIPVSTDISNDFQDFYAQVKRIYNVLEETWLSSRCGYQSEDRIVLKSVRVDDTLILSDDFRKLNHDCSRLLDEFKKAKSGVTS